MPNVKHKWRIVVKWTGKMESEFFVDNFTLSHERGVGLCETQSNDGTTRLIVVPEGSITVTEVTK